MNEAVHHPHPPPPPPPQYFHQSSQQLMARNDSLGKLKRLDEINASVLKIAQSIVFFLDELAKDKPTTARSKQLKTSYEELVKHLRKVESDLIEEIGALVLASTGHAHEGSMYGKRLNYDLAKMRMHQIAVQLRSLRDALDKRQ